MFDYLCGILTDAASQKVTLDVGGVGYGLTISVSTFGKLPPIGSKLKLYTSVVVREDSQKIYAFLQSQERETFERLIQISGIGPKISIALLGHLSLDDLYLAIEQGNAKVLCTVPGIGKKMGERLLLELRGTLDKEGGGIPLVVQMGGGVIADAINALTNLGYNPLDAQKVVRSVLPSSGECPPLPELISLALKTKKS